MPALRGDGRVRLPHVRRAQEGGEGSEGQAPPGLPGRGLPRLRRQAALEGQGLQGSAAPVRGVGGADAEDPAAGRVLAEGTRQPGDAAALSVAEAGEHG